MSLVDYASSDEDEEKVKDEVEESKDLKALKGKPDIAKVHAPYPPPKSQKISSTAHQSSTLSAAPSVMKLPDASMLLNSLESPSYPANYSDHSTWVAAAVARKRDASGFGSSSSSTHGKVPKTTPVHSKSIPDTIRGQLVPPQLKGRSNVVTEDIGKLFVKKKVELSTTTTQSVSDYGSFVPDIQEHGN